MMSVAESGCSDDYYAADLPQTIAIANLEILPIPVWYRDDLGDPYPLCRWRLEEVRANWGPGARVCVVLRCQNAAHIFKQRAFASCFHHCCRDKAGSLLGQKLRFSPRYVEYFLKSLCSELTPGTYICTDSNIEALSSHTSQYNYQLFRAVILLTRLFFVSVVYNSVLDSSGHCAELGVNLLDYQASLV